MVDTIKECCNSEAEICAGGVGSDAELFEKDDTCEIPYLMKEALDHIDNDDGQTEEKYGQNAVCNVKTLLEIALVDVQVVAYTVDRALSQLGCSSAPGDLCDILLEVERIEMGEANDEL